jgi:hypothetical protein
MRSIAKLLVLAISLAAFLPASHDACAAEVKTSKERLSNKAADEQRVDNCGVPVDQRGTTPRPDCGEGASPRSTPSETRDGGSNRIRN